MSDKPPRSHAHGSSEREFVPLGAAVLAVSDTRTLEDDDSGQLIREKLEGAGHRCVDRKVVVDEVEAVREQVLDWSRNEAVQAIIITGGTGVTDRDVTPEALDEIYDKQIPGFGELFRWLSFQDIGSSTIQSRATAGVVGGTLVFALPGSPNACRLAMDDILLPQFDNRTRPCSFVGLLDRI